MLDHKIIQLIPTDELSQQNGSYSFRYIWKEDEREEGHYLVRVFAIRKHVRSGEDVYIELTNSPYSLIRQKSGVIYALNVASPVYQDMNGIVYSSEFSLFANFDSTFEMGTQCKAAGMPKNMANLPASILKTDDGFLYARARTAEQYNEFDHRFTYKVDDLPNGTFKLRLHLTQPTFHLEVNGKDVNDEVNQKINDIIEASGNLKSNTAYSVDINVEITENCLLIQSRSGSDVYKNSDYMCAFALLDNSYTDKTISERQLKEEEQEKHKLADKALPMNIAVTRKEMTVVGWSPNLLKNASGENKDMKHWNISGDIRVCDASGYGTEACFRTSFMWSEKYQEVNLLDHLTAEYLDSAPDIQVSEWYKQGHCLGGFYCFTAQLMSDDGQVIKEYTTGELGSLTNSDWTEASVTFSGYGPGVRIVTFSSKGKDDKYWQGYFGPYISAAGIRVKKESKPAKNDSFSDIDRTDVTTKRSSLEKMVTNILTSNQSMFEDLVDDKNLPVDQEFEKQTDMSNELNGWKGGKKQTHKKREIRVFVSSTFRDFTLEREAIIKKAFREINRLCVDRGVFFTYVDLRWGITTEQTNDGKTIAICLQEIDRCRPYFICLMGDRFGWSQTEENKDETLNMTYDYAIENNPNLKWIDDYRYNTSVTQLEIFHGVLNNPDDVKDKCFFYLKNLPSQDEVSPELYKEYLKSLIQKNSKISVKKFNKADEVSELIKQDLKGCVDQEFPIGSELTKLEQQGEAHAAFASQNVEFILETRIILQKSTNTEVRIYHNRSLYLENQVIIQKSEYITTIHYTWRIRLFEEMKVFFSFDMQIPSSDTVLVHEIGKWLRMAGSLTKCVIVFDAVNQLDDGSGVGESTEHDLLWIPSEIPPNVFLLISTLPGRAMNACTEAGFPSMRVSPLQESEKMQIITDYLEGIYGKTLTMEQKGMIINVKQTSNPLYLKSLLDEVEISDHFKTKITNFLQYMTDNFRKDLVRDATTALWCSNRGMSESELVELLDIPSAVWSPFYISLYENLVNRNGILNFFHDHLRQAVERKYIPTHEAKVKGYLCLADFHAAKETSDRTSIRKFLFDHWNNGSSKKIFKTLIKQLELNYGESHGTVVYNVHDHTWKYRCKHPDVIKGLHELGTVYSKLGEYDKAVRVYIDAINRQNRVTTPTQKLQLCEGLLGLSTVYIQKEDMLEAKKLMLRALELATFVLGKKHNFVAAIFTRLGQLSYKQGRVDEALAYCLHDLKVTRSEVGTNHPRTAIVLNEIGLIYDDKNDSMAPQLYEAALSIFLETYGKNFLGTGTIRYNLGALYFGTNHFAKSKYQFTESYRVYVLFGRGSPRGKSRKAGAGCSFQYDIRRIE
ncbi:NPHP3 [Mytilus edulis]|uniref:NPHP3 n=1 Tax=Mytilus edulis TaxID=6550 RepID=A0A8S3S6U2_MYTED|nr:NPHP3 [Mytilus edulis]